MRAILHKYFANFLFFIFFRILNLRIYFFRFSKVFSMLSSLKELYLQGNDLTYLQSGVFVNLLDLKIINLMNNRLNMSDNLNNDVWLSNLWKCTNIEEIILRNNSVKTIYKDWTWFPNLKILDLNHNLIDKLEVSIYLMVFFFFFFFTRIKILFIYFSF